MSGRTNTQPGSATRETSPLIEILACPGCGDSLEADLRCRGCARGYPSIGGIPWLFAEPHAEIVEWRQRLGMLLAKLRQDVSRHSRALESPNLLAATRKRLEWLKDATEDHARRLADLLGPLEMHETGLGIEAATALRTRPPADQGLTTYYPNLHRDWAWGDAENNASLGLLLDMLDGAGERPRVVVLGSGAGRLAYDLHRAAGAQVTVALDFNPLLQLAARRLTTGEALELYEFPLAPRSIEDHAVLRTLRAPEPISAGFHILLGDALHPPFRAASFDVVVTPWLIDVLSADFGYLCSCVNGLLAPQGRWLNFGSLQFHQPEPAGRYSLEECELVVQEKGFDRPTVTQAEIPYMCSPASRHGRRETVVAWSALKRENSDAPEPHRAAPDWLVEGDDPVPLLESFRIQAASTRIYALIMSLVDGRRSLKDMAKIMIDQRLMSESEAESTLRTFLEKLLAESERPDRY